MEEHADTDSQAWGSTSCYRLIGQGPTHKKEITVGVWGGGLVKLFYARYTSLFPTYKFSPIFILDEFYMSLYRFY